MDITPALLSGSIRGIDHITFGYPLGTEPRVAINFFASLGVEMACRDEPCKLDDFLPGMRYDFRLGETTVTFAPDRRRFFWPEMLVRCVFRFRPHVAFLISPRVFDDICEHPRVDWSLGEEGRVRWGTGDWSVFMTGPYGLRFEFRCPTAHHMDS